MRYYLLAVLQCVVFFAFAQLHQPDQLGKGSTLFNHDRIFVEKNTPVVNPQWAPFYHGVASGDPLADRVVIWTRVTAEDATTESTAVQWRMATDPALTDTVATGVFITDKSRDYTVKVDVTGLAPGTTYYYGFVAFNKASLTGKTKTTPVGEEVTHLKFGVVSCSNYQAGYFNAYGQLAKRTDLDAIIHLGDYIYEYGNFVYGDDSIWEDRIMEPSGEINELAEYRARYSTYRLDTQLLRLHQQHPMIAVWDDHESANDSYKDGAQNHSISGSEGSWEDRKAFAKQAYFEWLPIRDNAENRVYRRHTYGDLVDLIMLDTRLESRERQVEDVNDPILHDPERTILGVAQKAWLLDALASSTARWKLIGQQVLFSEFNVGWAGLVTGMSYEETESRFLDIWDGYPAERSQIIQFMDSLSINNVVILTGDFHSSFALDVADAPVQVGAQIVAGDTMLQYTEVPHYDPVTGQGSVAVEFATPSVCSANFDENAGLAIASVFQDLINSNIAGNGDSDIGNPNPHMKYADLIQHGYYILDLRADSAQANFYYTPIQTVSSDEQYGTAYYTKDGENHLQAAFAASGPKSEQDIPAPAQPPLIVSNGSEPALLSPFVLLSAHPNPANQRHDLHYALNQRTHLRIRLHQSDGQLLKVMLDETLPAGIYSLATFVENLPKGTYLYQIEVNGQLFVHRMLKI